MGIRGDCAAAVGALFVALPAPALAAPCTVTWDGDVGDWTDETHWSTASVPGPGDVACVPAGVVMHASGSHAVDMLQISEFGQVQLSGGDLTLGSATTTERSTFINDDGAVTVEVTGGTLRVDGLGADGDLLRVTGGTVAVASGAVLDVVALEGGNAVVTGAGQLTVGNGGMLQSGSDTDVLRVDVASMSGARLIAEGGTLDVRSSWDGLMGTSLLASLTVFLDGEIRLPGAVTRIASTSNVDIVRGRIEAGTPSESAFAGSVTLDGGSVSVNTGVLPVGSLTLQAGGVLSLANGATLAATGTVTVAQDGRARGEVGGTPEIVAASPVVVMAGGRLEGSIGVTPGLDVQGGTWAPYGSPDVSVDGDAALGGTYEVWVGVPAEEVSRATVDGTATLGSLQVFTAGPLPPIGSEWTILDFTSAIGAVPPITGALLRDPAGDRALVLRLEATALRARVVASAPPISNSPAVTIGTDGRLNVTASVNAGGLRTGVRMEYGTTMAYGSQVVLPSIAATEGVVPISGQTPDALPPGTYHLRLVFENEYGTTPGGDVVVTVPPPAVPPVPPVPPVTPVVPEPVVPVVPTALAAVLAAGPRTLTVTRLRFGAMRVPFTYRLAGTCTTPCRARVELRVRSGRQRFDVRLAGDGKVVATRRNVLLKRGLNSLRIDVSKAALRGVPWMPAGRFRTLRARLRVVLPQADGRELVTVRDVTLRARRP